MLRYIHLALLITCLLALASGLSVSAEPVQAAVDLSLKPVTFDRLNMPLAHRGILGVIGILPPLEQKELPGLRRIRHKARADIQLSAEQPEIKPGLTIGSGYWDPKIGDPGMDEEVYSLATGDAGLYAGGMFTEAGGVPATYIARWDGTHWSALPGLVSYDPIEEGVAALATHGSDLYVGGWFGCPQASSRSFVGIAKWDGGKWSSLGSGVNGVVLALALSGDTLYVGGIFDKAGGVEAKNIAKWDMKRGRWSPVGGGVDGWVRAFAIDGSDLYVGGSFTRATNTGPAPQSTRSVVANGIAKWNGQWWSALGSGVNISGCSACGEVFSIAVSKTRMYVSGSFNKAGEASANSIAEWVKLSKRWAPLGAGRANGVGPDGLVHSIALSGSVLYVGGTFWLAEGIAQWDLKRRTWSMFEGGSVVSNTNGPWVDAILVKDHDIYLAGYFNAAVGVGWSSYADSNYVALWHGSP